MVEKDKTIGCEETDAVKFSIRNKVSYRVHKKRIAH